LKSVATHKSTFNLLSKLFSNLCHW